MEENNPHPFILSPMFRDTLINVINMLYPDDFVRLAACSKDMRNVCYQTPGVAVRFRLDIRVDEDGNVPKFSFHSRCWKWKKLSWAEMKDLMDLPFRFEVSAVSYYNYRFVPTNRAIVAATRGYLEELGAQKIDMLFVSSFVSDWNELVPLTKDYQPQQVFANNDGMSDEMLHELMGMKLYQFACGHSDARDEDIVRCNIRQLDINATFSKECATEIIRRWLAKDLVIGEWSIGSSTFSDADLRSLFRPFVTIYCDHYEGPLLDVRPIVVISEDDNGKDHYFLVRHDNKVLNVFLWGHRVDLVTEHNFSRRPEMIDALEHWNI